MDLMGTPLLIAASFLLFLFLYHFVFFRVVSRLADYVSVPYQRTLEQILLREMKNWKLPRHIAIVMDGNRRYAKSRGIATYEGHAAGAQRLVEVLEWMGELNIPVVTAWCLSVDNLKREKQELEKIFELFERYFVKVSEDGALHKHEIRICFIGHRTLLPEKVQKQMAVLEAKTANYSRYTLNIAIAYGGREELVHAFKDIALEACEEWEKAKKETEQEKTAHSLNEFINSKIQMETINKHLLTTTLPEPDLIIRTGGEQRLSGFLLWQSAYSELYFSNKHWPAFNKVDLLTAVQSFSQRQRRFGK